MILKHAIGFGLAVAAVFLANVLLVWMPARDCNAIGGQPVLGIGRVVCVQPYTPAKKQVRK